MTSRLKPQLLDSAGQPLSNVKVTNDSRMVHFGVKKVAMEMAGAYYERAASRDDHWYADHPDQSGFIENAWPHFVLTARQTLTAMLTNEHYDARAKEQIYDLLCLDATLPYHPNETQIVNVN